MLSLHRSFGIRPGGIDANGWGSRALAVLTAVSLCAVGEVAFADEYRAFWVDAWGAGIQTQDQVESLLGVPGTAIKGKIREANCNAVFVQARRNCDTCYSSGVGEPFMSGLSPTNFNALQAVINAAHDTTGGKQRIEVHGWLVTFRTSGGAVYERHTDAPTGSLTRLDNYWPSRDAAGAETTDKALDPGHPLVLEYTVNACMDLVNNFDVDGLHFDYVRFSGKDEGYNPTSISRYNARYGLTGRPTASDERFKQWRRDQVTALVRQVYARIQKCKPWVKLSGSFVTWNPAPVNSSRTAFQATRPYAEVYSDWDAWMREGIVDLAVPMTYYDFAAQGDNYVKWLNFEKDCQFNRHLIIGVGTYLNSLTNAIWELQLTREASPSGNRPHGFCVFSWRGPCLDDDESDFRTLFVSQITPAWSDVPTMHWKTAPTNGHVMGTVTMGGNGTWADHAVVNLTGPVNRTNYVDGTGFFAFMNLPPGSYTVTANRTGYSPATAVVKVAVGAVTGNMYERNLVLKSGPALVF